MKGQECVFSETVNRDSGSERPLREGGACHNPRRKSQGTDEASALPEDACKNNLRPQVHADLSGDVFHERSG